MQCIPFLIFLCSGISAFHDKSLKPLKVGLIANIIILLIALSAEDLHGNGGWGIPVFQILGIPIIGLITLVIVSAKDCSDDS